MELSRTDQPQQRSLQMMLISPPCYLSVTLRSFQALHSPAGRHDLTDWCLRANLKYTVSHGPYRYAIIVMKNGPRIVGTKQIFHFPSSRQFIITTSTWSRPSYHSCPSCVSVTSEPIKDGLSYRPCHDQRLKQLPVAAITKRNRETTHQDLHLQTELRHRWNRAKLVQRAV